MGASNEPRVMIEPIRGIVNVQRTTPSVKAAQPHRRRTGLSFQSQLEGSEFGWLYGANLQPQHMPDNGLTHRCHRREDERDGEAEPVRRVVTAA
jgi:hypothetical protein